MKKKKLKQILFDSICKNFIQEFETDDKSIIFIVPTNNQQSILKYEKYLKDNHNIQLKEDFLHLKSTNINLLINLYKILSNKLMNLDKEKIGIVTPLILKMDIFKKLIQSLKQKGYTIIVLNNTSNKILNNRLNNLSSEFDRIVKI